MFGWAFFASALAADPGALHHCTHEAAGLSFDAVRSWRLVAFDTRRVKMTEERATGTGTVQANTMWVGVPDDYPDTITAQEVVDGYRGPKAGEVTTEEGWVCGVLADGGHVSATCAGPGNAGRGPVFVVSSRMIAADWTALGGARLLRDVGRSAAGFDRKRTELDGGDILCTTPGTVPEPPLQGACHFTSGEQCQEEYSALRATGARMACDGPGTWNTERCPTDGLLARCDKDDGSSRFYYYRPAERIGVDVLKQGCEAMEGVFTVPGAGSSPAR